jgi:hypothetical protein
VNHVSNVNPEHLFKADPTIVQHLKTAKSNLYQLCSQHIGRRVRVETIDGQTLEGVIVQLDENHLFLNVMPESMYRSPAYAPYAAPYAGGYGAYGPFGGGYGGYGYGPYAGYGGYNPYTNTILPLVLFNLLTVSLLH